MILRFSRKALASASSIGLVLALTLALLVASTSVSASSASAATKPKACGGSTWLVFQKPLPGMMVVYNCSPTTKRYVLWFETLGGLLHKGTYCISISGYGSRTHWDSFSGSPVGIQGC